MFNNIKIKRTVFRFSIVTILFCLLSLSLALVLNESGNESSCYSQSEYNSYQCSVLESSIAEASAVFNETSEIKDTLSENDCESIDETSVNDVFEHGWIINELGYTYVYGDAGYEQFNYKTTALERYINSLNNVASSIPQSSRIFSITAPVSSTFADIPRDVYKKDNFYNQSQSAFVSTVASRLNSCIINIPIVSKLEEQYDNGEYVFFRTDKNWTSLAAYTAYLEYCNAAGFVPYSIENFSKTVELDFLGCFYNSTKMPSMESNPDSLICYSCIPSVKTNLTVYAGGMLYDTYELCNNKAGINNAYDVYLGRTAGRYELSTTVEGGNLLIIGDSSANPFIPFIACHYSKIDFIDPRYFTNESQDFFTNREYDDVLIMCYSTNAVSGEYIPSLNILFGENYE